MDQITLHDSFVPEDCPGTEPRRAVTIEAGARWLPTYNAVTTKAGRYVQGGGCATVGVAGLIQSGGFGSFSKNYGMAAAPKINAIPARHYWDPEYRKRVQVRRGVSRQHAGRALRRSCRNAASVRPRPT
jgi:hypothetical protein